MFHIATTAPGQTNRVKHGCGGTGALGAPTQSLFSSLGPFPPIASVSAVTVARSGTAWLNQAVLD